MTRTVSPSTTPRGLSAPNILLVNPWIHDFAAYDFWAKPMGLLYLAAVLRRRGYHVHYIDCLDRFHPNEKARRDPPWRYGRGPYRKTPIPKPPVLADIPRRYCRYGISPEWLRQDLETLPRPDLILVTSIMTYWYPGVRETILTLKAAFPRTPILLGGIYATLCPQHAARHTGADQVITGMGDGEILRIASDYTGLAPGTSPDPDDLDALPYPAFDLARQIPYVPLTTSRGCPFRCAYCASHRLSPRLLRRSPHKVVEEIHFWHRRFGVVDFVFYDDALLVDAETHAHPLLEGVIAAGLRVRFHTPNALHIRAITARTADLMKRAGFTTVRLGLETTAFEKRSGLDAKVTAAEFERGVACLKEAGFRRDQLGAYLLVGLPEEDFRSVAASVAMVKASGIMPIPAFYTPIPHTALWPRAAAVSRYPLEEDPLFTNNAIFPCQREAFSWDKVARLKKLIEAP